jgi:hypothetical protein
MKIAEQNVAKIEQGQWGRAARILARELTVKA